MTLSGDRVLVRVKESAPDAVRPVTGPPYVPSVSLQKPLHADPPDVSATLLASQALSAAPAPPSPATWSPLPEHIRAVAASLRALEKEASGLRRERWGNAAANAEAAARAHHSVTRRRLCAAACDYARLVAAAPAPGFTAEGDLPVRRVDGWRAGRGPGPTSRTIIISSQNGEDVATLRARLSGADSLPTRRARG